MKFNSLLGHTVLFLSFPQVGVRYFRNYTTATCFIDHFNAVFVLLHRVDYFPRYGFEPEEWVVVRRRNLRLAVLMDNLLASHTHVFAYLLSFMKPGKIRGKQRAVDSKQKEKEKVFSFPSLLQCLEFFADRSIST